MTKKETYRLTVGHSYAIADELGFLQEFDRYSLHRVRVNYSINLTPECRQQLTKIEAQITEENHTPYPHTLKKCDKDTEHELKVHKQSAANSNSILVCQDRPIWAKKRYFFITAVLGLSPLIRRKLSSESNET